MDLYFSHSRQREHLPNIPGVYRLAKAEVVDDLESIKAASKSAQQQYIDATTTTATATLTAPNGDIAIANEVQVLPSSSSSTSALPTALTSSAASSSRPRRKLDTYTNSSTATAIAGTSSTSASATTVPASAIRAGNGATTATGLIPRIIDSASSASSGSTSSSSKRQRLEYRIHNERRNLDDVLRVNLTSLRGELEMLRSTNAQYEEAISSSKREIELAKREKEELYEQFTALKGEYELSVATTETARQDEEKAEMELRDRLAQATQIAADAQSRVDQLQLIETEFKTKDLTIAHLREDINKLQQETASYKNALQSKPFNPALVNTASNQSQPQHSPASPASPNQLQPPSASPTSPNAPIASINNNNNAASSSTNGAPFDVQRHPSALSTSSNTNSAASNLQALSSTMKEAGMNINTDVRGIMSVAKAGSSGVIMLTGDFIRYVEKNTERLSSLQKTIKTLQTERDHLAIQVQEREQLLHTQYAQIERITKFNADLQSTVKVSSALLHDERLKHEQTLKQMHVVMQQRAEANHMISMFEEKIFAFDSVLAISDNRALSAELGIHDQVHELKTLRTSLRTLQESYNKLLQQHTILQQYHQNICNLVLDSSASGDIDSKDIHMLQDHHLLHSALAGVNNSPNVDKTSSRDFNPQHITATSSALTGNVTRSRKHTLTRHEGTDLATYSQLVDYKTLFHKMRDVLMKNISRRDIELLTPNTPNSALNNSTAPLNTQQQYSTKHEEDLYQVLTLDSNKMNGSTAQSTTQASAHENGNLVNGSTAGTASPSASAASELAIYAKMDAPVINEKEVDELSHIAMPS